MATVHEHLTNLERKGYIRRSYNESRAIEILPSEAYPPSISLPLLGAVAAGVAIEHSTTGETVSVPDDFVRPTRPSRRCTSTARVTSASKASWSGCCGGSDLRRAHVWAGMGGRHLAAPVSWVYADHEEWTVVTES